MQKKLVRQKNTAKKNEKQVTNLMWLTKARQYALTYASKHSYVTSDDVVAALGVPQDSPSLIGSIFQKNMFTKIGYTPSARNTTHGREIGVWRAKK